MRALPDTDGGCAVRSPLRAEECSGQTTAVLCRKTWLHYTSQSNQTGFSGRALAYSRQENAA